MRSHEKWLLAAAVLGPFIAVPYLGFIFLLPTAGLVLVAWILAEDVEGRELYLAYARQGRCGMWVRIPDDGRVPEALLVLADFDCLFARYYGRDEQHDFNLA